MNKFLTLVYTVAITVLLCCSAYADKYEVVRVIDGDTLVVQAGDKSEKVRLYGIDAPEHRGKQPLWEEAKNKTEEMVLGKVVDIRVHGVDLYGRIIGIIEVNSTTVNEELIKLGLAVYYKEYCKDKDYCQKLEAEESDARSAGAGLWALDNFVVPSAWRASIK